MRKKLVLVVMLLSTFMGCTIKPSTVKTPGEPPEIKIAIDGKKIDYVVEKNKWGGSVYDREDTFKTIMKKDPDIPYIKIGKTVEVDFGKNVPDKLVISDIIINNDGSQLYQDNVNYKPVFELNEGKRTFKIDKNPASFLSSYYVENKKDIRGIRIIASWGENECEYAFVFMADAF